MRQLFLFLLAAPLFATPPVVSNVSFIDVGYSSVSVLFDSNGTYNKAQVLWTVAPNSCTDGTTTTGGGTRSYSFSGGAYYTTLNITGMTPGQTYQVCPELSNDNGSTWSTGVGATVTLNAMPPVPQEPVAPAQFDTSFPDLTKGTCWSNSQPGYCTVVVDTPCVIAGTGSGGDGSSSGPLGSVANDIAHGMAHQDASGTIVLIPAGQVCNDSNLTWDVPVPDRIRFDQSAVANNQITMPQALSSYTQAGPNGITEGQGIELVQVHYNPAIPYTKNLNGSNYTLPNYIYFVHTTGANTFELYWPWTHIKSVSVTSGSNQIHVPSLVGQGGATLGVLKNAEVVGAGIPAGTTVSAISGWEGAYTITLSAAATASAIEDLTFGGGDISYYSGPNTQNMPVQLFASETGPLTSGQYDAMFIYPRNLYWVDIRSCVEGKNCIASWDSATAYAIGDETTVGGEVYQAVAANTNQAPPNAAYWTDTGRLSDLLQSTLPPDGMRINPSWKPALATLEKPPFQYTDVHHIHYFIPFSSATDGENAWEGSNGTSHIRFDDLRIVFTPNTEVSSDPMPTNGLFGLPAGVGRVSDIVFNQILSDKADYKLANRSVRFAWWIGHNVAITNSYLQLPPNWVATYNGRIKSNVAPKQAATPTSFTIAPVTVTYGAPSPASLSSTMTISWTGTPDSSIATPEIAVYFDMSGSLHIIAPQGITLTASPQTPAIAYTTLSGNGDCNEWEPFAPVDSHGRGEWAPLGCAQLSAAGDITSLIAGGIPGVFYGSGGYTEAGDQIEATGGPGPFKFSNNYYEWDGIGLIFDDAGYWKLSSDFTVERNTFRFPVNFLFTKNNSRAQAADFVTTGLYVGGHTQPLEWKEGSRIRIRGNTFSGIHGDESEGYAEDLTPSISGSMGPLVPNAYGSTDINIVDNVFAHLPSGVTCPQNYADGQLERSPAFRCHIENNVFWDINGLAYSVTGGTNYGAASGEGIVAMIPEDNEGAVFSHNTVLPSFGTNAGIISDNGEGTATYGTTVTNNILWYGNNVNNTNFTFSAGGASSVEDALTNNWHATVRGNVFVPALTGAPGYPLSGSESQYSVASITNGLGSYAADNTILSPSTLLGSLGSIGWYDLKNFVALPPGSWDSDGQYTGPIPNFRLKSTSAYNTGSTDGLQAGANINALERARGKVTLVGANQITTDSANITYIAPDSAGCAVDYSSSDPMLINSFTRVSDGGGARVRNVSLTGLSAGKSYSYRVDCAVQQPTGKFATN